MNFQFLLEAAAAILILGIAGWGTNRLLRFYFQAKRELEELINFLETNIEGRPLLTVFALLEERLQQSRYLALADAWREFNASLLKSIRNISTTVRTDTYFNDHSLVDGPLKADLIRNIPGILTGLGIVGTFAGVIIGLNGYSSQDLASVRTSINHLLQSVKFAFCISLLAVFSAIVFTGVEKWFTSQLYVLVARFQQTLSRIFTQSVSDEYLQRMVEQLEEQGGALKSFSHDLSETMKLSVAELVQNQNATLRENNLQFAETVKQALVDELSPVLNRLTEVMGRVQETQADAGQTIIQQMVHDFKNTLDSTTSRQMEAVTGALEGTVGLLSGVQQGIENFAGTLRNETQQQQEVVTAQIRSLAEQAQQQQATMEACMMKFMDQMNQGMTKQQDDITHRHVEAAASIERGMMPLLQAMQTGSDGLLTGLETFTSTLRNETQQQQEILTVQVQALAGQAQQQQAAMELYMLNFMEQVNRDMTKQQEEIAQRHVKAAASLENGMTPLLHAMQAAGNGLLAGLEQAAGKLHQEGILLNGLIENSQQLVREYHTVLSQSKETGLSWSESARTFAAVSQELKPLSIQFGQGQKLFAESITAFQTHLRQSVDQSKVQSQMVDHYQTMGVQIKADMEKQQRSLLALDENISQDLKRYVELTSKSLSDYLHQVDENLGKVSNHMRGMTEELTESVNELIEVLEKNNKQR